MLPKLPSTPPTGKNAMPNEPSTWGTLAAAQAAVTRYGLRGVGVLLGDGLCGIDIDHCRDPATGALSDMAVQTLPDGQLHRGQPQRHRRAYPVHRHKTRRPLPQEQHRAGNVRRRPGISP